MKKFILSCLLLAGISTAISAQGIVEGAKAPDFSAKKVDGTTFTLSSLQGKYVVIDFWGSWCKWCIKGFPDMKTAYAKHKGKVEFVGIACRDTEEKWKDRMSRGAFRRWAVAAPTIPLRSLRSLSVPGWSKSGPTCPAS